MLVYHRVFSPSYAVGRDVTLAMPEPEPARLLIRDFNHQMRPTCRPRNGRATVRRTRPMSSLAKLAHAPAASRCTHTLVAAALRRVGSTSASTSSPAAPRGRIVGGRHHHHHHLGIRRQHRLVRTAAAADVDTDAILASYLDDAQMNQVRTFAATLLEKNKVMNLTGAATIDEVLTRHVADSLALLPAIERALGPDVSAANAKIRVMDVGSGAGFPGIALAIARPAWEVTLLDTLQKRTSFLDAAAAECGATNVRTLWSRAEDAGKVGSEHREAYDVVTARAVAELRILAELCVPLVKVQGAFVAMKNSLESTETETADASNAIDVLGGTPLVSEEVQSVGPDGALRTAVVSVKTRATPEKYPRRAGMPNKRPL